MLAVTIVQAWVQRFEGLVHYGSEPFDCYSHIHRVIVGLRGFLYQWSKNMFAKQNELSEFPVSCCHTLLLNVERYVGDYSSNGLKLSNIIFYGTDVIFLGLNLRHHVFE